MRNAGQTLTYTYTYTRVPKQFPPIFAAKIFQL